ncbi:MAG: hypothetical protein HOA57_03645 [Candidatus Magasanikbacteria bacterium]|jgi:hypothetical protein|nr:hypothetical protein [Candidatus Magasanikbacteria bacterium]MBT4314565.1 hypothetical protein [Candidatus Magasanikbacteria bacterium]MBT4547463.1 hypothetical protein [Candidatus Magasanikbacteria bacterium]MBT6819445.1 hypothetical protein [Candidatus Magasanikbacteria bacterium]
MFCCKNKQKDYSLIIFGSIAFLIILSVVFILVVFLNKVDDLKKPVKDEIDNYIPAKVSSLLIAEKYSEDLSDLRDDIAVTVDSTKTFKLLENVFFSVKVPKEMLDHHLQTFLQINSIKEKKGSSEEVLTLLDELIRKIDLYYEKESN